MSNHLGNFNDTWFLSIKSLSGINPVRNETGILTVINDIKVPQSSKTLDVDSYLATIVSTADYSPFGVQLAGRTVSVESYRYRFQGQEMDDEIKGEGNSVNYKYRMHCLSRHFGNPRVGRFFAVDPLANQYPHNSPFAFSENRVLDKIELEGLEAWEPENAKIDVMSLRDYHNVVTNQIIPLAKVSHKELKFDCNDLALFCVMKYFEIKQVEYNVEVNGRKYSSSDPKYSSFKQFYEVVRGQISCSITQDFLSESIDAESSVAGDMYLSSTHTFVVLGPVSENVGPREQEVIYGSGYYYGKNDPRTRVDLLEETTLYLGNGGAFSLRRWMQISDLPFDSPVPERMATIDASSGLGLELNSSLAPMPQSNQ